MAGRPNPNAELLTAVPGEVRTRILSGMRWTLWLSALAAPFGYGTSILLARTGPEVIGTYGLLMVYVGLVSSFLYLGGDAVAIKFLPELETDRRLSFLISYFLVICLCLLPWLLASVLWPDKLRYLFGHRGGSHFQALLLCLAPIYILFSLVVAALKGMLEIRWAQGLARMVTIGSFLLYALLFLAAPQLLAGRPTELIWSIYLVLAGLAAAIGVGRLLRLYGPQFQRPLLRFFLPPGFWRYTLSLEQVSVVWFFIVQLDAILVLNFGGLRILGKYVAIQTVALTIRVANNFFLDTLLPSLTNLVTGKNLSGASQVLSMQLRILFLVDTAITCGLMLLAGPITSFLGPEYASLRLPLILMVLLVGLSSPGAVGGTLLTSVGKQQHSLWVGLGQLGLFVFLFLGLWPRWQLLGAVLAWGLALLASHSLLWAVAKRSVPIELLGGRDYLKFGSVSLAVAAVAAVNPVGLGAALPAWALSVGAFLLLANYRFDECREMIRCFSPGRLRLTGAEEADDREVQAALPGLRPEKEMGI